MLTSLKQQLIRVLAHRGFRRYFANTSWLFAEQILRLLAGLFVGIWVARYLGPEQFGIFSYALSFVALFAVIAKLGLDQIVVRELVKQPQNQALYLGTSFWLKLAGFLLMLAFLIAGMALTSNSDTTNLYIFIIACGVAFQAFEIVDFHFRAHVNSKVIAAGRMAQLILSSLIKIWLVIYQAELIWFVVVTLLDQIVMAVIFHFSYSLTGKQSFYFHFSKSIAVKLLKNSWPLLFGSMVVMLYMRIDQVMLQEMLGAREVGLYSAAVRISEAWYFIPVVLGNLFFPAIVQSRSVDQKLYYLRLQRLFALTVWIALIIAIPFGLLSEYIILLLYGEAYREAGNALMWQVWAGVFVYMGTISGNWLAAENMQKIAMLRTLAGALVNIALNLKLIPLYGIAGAAIATLFSYMVAGLLFDLLMPRTRILFRMKLKAIFLKGLEIGR